MVFNFHPTAANCCGTSYNEWQGLLPRVTRRWARKGRSLRAPSEQCARVQGGQARAHRRRG
eukprot:scaffold6416_cov113-Isochrysis_galbana.AAC.3